MNTQENNTLYPYGDYNNFDLWSSREPSAPSHSGNTHTSHSRSPILSSPTRPSSRTPSAQSPHSTPQPQLVKRKRKSLTPQPPSHSPSKRAASVAQTPQRSPTPKLQNASTAIGSPHEPKAATNKGRQVKPLYGQGIPDLQSLTIDLSPTSDDSSTGIRLEKPAVIYGPRPKLVVDGMSRRDAQSAVNEKKATLEEYFAEDKRRGRRDMIQDALSKLDSVLSQLQEIDRRRNESFKGDVPSRGTDTTYRDIRDKWVGLYKTYSRLVGELNRMDPTRTFNEASKVIESELSDLRKYIKDQKAKNKDNSL